MKAFLIDPLKVGPQVITQIEIESGMGADWIQLQVCAHLGLDYAEDPVLERIDVGPEDWACELTVAGSKHRQEVRRLGEFRIMKSGGDYASYPGRGIVLGYDGAASQLMGILASSGVWVSA